MAQMRMAKATDDDIDVVIKFFNLFEQVCENGEFNEKDLSEWDDEDEDRLEIQKFIIKKEDKWARGSHGELDYFAFFEHWCKRIAPRWRRVVFGCQVMIENACDPMESHLAYSPYLEEFHVAPEQ